MDGPVRAEPRPGGFESSSGQKSAAPQGG
jgi:hypothetical protein